MHTYIRTYVLASAHTYIIELGVCILLLLVVVVVVVVVLVLFNQQKFGKRVLTVPTCFCLIGFP